MQISSRFTIAIHILVFIEHYANEYFITSDLLSASIQVHPVIIRNIMLKLKAAGMIRINRRRKGGKGTTLAKPLEEITLYDVYEAVDCVKGSLFHFHEHPNPDCPVGKNIHAALDGTLLDLQNTFENKMKQTTVRDIAEKI
ncbi:MAG: Rrf2 family transcriptional regulator [Synergistaceae bacterium]|nr:Rrf2 family transcriptional regulator [Synergistaceae bacterium]